MSKTTFLGLTNRNNTCIQKTTKNSKNTTNPIENNEFGYEFSSNIQKTNSTLVDEKTAEKAINKAKQETNPEYEFYDNTNNQFNPNSILDEYEITKDDLQYATGEQLLGLYFEADYTQDNNYKEHNAMLITLLSNANTEQIKDFMSSFESLTQNYDDWDPNYNFSYDNLGKQLLYVARAKNITGEEDYKNFMENVAKNPDLFPSYNEYIGIAYGNQL